MNQAFGQQVKSLHVPVALTGADFFTWDKNTPLPDEDFFISRVPLSSRISTNKQTEANPLADNQRKLNWWCPFSDVNSGNYGTIGQPRPFYESEAFSMWQYLEVHGSWGTGFLGISAALLDQAHRHGVKVIGNIFIDWGVPLTRGGSNPQSQFLTELTRKDGTGNFVHVNRLIDMMEYYGYDGIGFNLEGSGMGASWADDLQDLLAALYTEAASRGLAFHSHWYDAQTENGQLGFYEHLNPGNDEWFHRNGKVVNNGFMLNYNWTNSNLATSVSAATGLGRSSYDVYAGMHLGGRGLRGGYGNNTSNDPNGGWKWLPNHNVSFTWWGEHKQNNAYKYSRSVGGSAQDIQNRYQKLLEQMYSGGNQNPSNTPAITNSADFTTANTFHGIARFITAKSTLDSLPFTTRFSLGNGLKFYDKGEVTHDNEWHHIGVQDYMPSWRWWITGNTGIKAAFTHDEAYSGGSCLELTGNVNSAKADINLYKTEFVLSDQAQASVIYKIPDASVGSDSKLSLALAFSNNPGQFTYFDLGNVSQLNEWNTTNINLSAHGGKTIVKVGIAVDGASQSSYKALVGELSITNGSVATPAAPVNFTANTAHGSDGTNYLKMKWELPGNPRYNGNIWYFDIIKEDALGSEKVVTRTSSRAHYIPNLSIGTGESLKVVSVAYDGKTKSNPQVISGNTTPATSDFTFSLQENSAIGTLVGTVTGTDVDNDSLSFGILSGNWGEALQIDNSTGQITVKDDFNIDYEAYPVFSLQVSVSDQLASAVSNVTVNITDFTRESPVPPTLGTNMDFEQGKTNWTSLFGVTTIDNTGGRNNSKGLVLNSQSAVAQSVTVEANTDYRLFGWGKATTGIVRIGVLDHGKAEENVSTSAREWTRISMVFTTTSDTKITIFAYSNGNGIIDDLHLCRADEMMKPIPTSILEGATSSNTLTIFPNPVKGKQFQFMHAAREGELVLKVYSLEGLLIHSEIFSERDHDRLITIQLDRNVKGPYLVQLIGQNDSVVKKLIFE
ncbi:MAG: cadherin domain-containing protein [Cytophagales bacterium]|nr:cadherin domain-containing protein [Cytophagales bacterium]